MKISNITGKENWYKSRITKWILIFVVNILVLVISFNMLFIYQCPKSISNATSWFDSDRPYEDSISFQDLFHYAIRNVVESLQFKYNFETEGKYNQYKIVDIMEYAEKGEVSGENKNGLAYTIGQLNNWGEIYSDTDIRDDTVIVCQKPDNTYYYYYLDGFKNLFDSGEFQLRNTDVTKEEFLNNIETYIPTTSDFGISITDKQEKVIYESFWRFPYTLTEKYSPEGAANILEIVNNTPALNGKLTEVYDALQQTIDKLNGELEEYRYLDDMWEEGNTNFTYMFVDKNKKHVYTNNSSYEKFNEVNSNLSKLKTEQGKYIIVEDKLSDFDTNMEISKQDWRNTVRSYYKGNKTDYVFAAAVDTKYPIQDVFYTYEQDYKYYMPRLRGTVISLVINIMLLLLSVIWLTVITGEKNEKGEIILREFDHWKTEFFAVGIVLFWAIPVAFVSAMFGNPVTMVTEGRQIDYVQDITSLAAMESHSYYSLVDYIAIGIFVIFTTCCFLIGYFSLVRRIKAKILWKNSALCTINNNLKMFWKKRTEVSKVTFILIGFIGFHWIAWIFISPGTFFAAIVLLIMIILDIMVASFMIKDAIVKRKIKVGIEELVKGNMEYQISTSCLKGEYKELAEEINDIGKGLHKAVDSAMKSERLKTDLITNVSHDIKTPLTSIINYVDLLKREHFEDPKILGYLDILSEKSLRLKTLTEDVVEASKVSSGNISLEYMDVNFVEMINQTEGELLEKFENNNLKIIQNLPEEPAIIHVDGRRMWRILENIYTNALKYAMPGTRVYSQLQVAEEKVIFSLKNISKQQLNFTADELTERFIRGDISRGSEGSGLGLSIAKSLTKMQGGEFNLYLDGDLFKVTIEFPKVK